MPGRRWRHFALAFSNEECIADALEATFTSLMMLVLKHMVVNVQLAKETIWRSTLEHILFKAHLRNSRGHHTSNVLKAVSSRRRNSDAFGTEPLPVYTVRPCTRHPCRWRKRP
ncbi:hypothetical protein DOTSEDRAFT_70736 [Dothistroma septosporum NZE10]|uniref:Uncharacterized protein n=1 Tax=Dothistroma septosporum (strain NZE10 / CBS 128990) TaxID=675120 RepID=N1PWU0_DOTSN|nr:hypothetical protein DOTSEDRAFT_70736 [Dothistroma septosporum NZE10]